MPAPTSLRSSSVTQISFLLVADGCFASVKCSLCHSTQTQRSLILESYLVWFVFVDKLNYKVPTECGSYTVGILPEEVVLLPSGWCCIFHWAPQTVFFYTFVQQTFIIPHSNPSWQILSIKESTNSPSRMMNSYTIHVCGIFRLYWEQLDIFLIPLQKLW